MLRIIFILMCVCIPSVAMDDFFPIEKESLELGYFLSKENFLTNYDNDGSSNSIGKFDSTITTMSIQLKYGILKGLDIEAVLPSFIFKTGLTSLSKSNAETDEITGFASPSIGIKYGYSPLGLGVFIDYTLPVGSKQIIGTSPTQILTLGALYKKHIKKIKILSNVSYSIPFENRDRVQKGNKLKILIKPAYYVNQSLQAYMKSSWLMTDKTIKSNQSIDNTDAQNLNIAPGFYFFINRGLSFEANVPFTIFGKNSAGGWGIDLKIRKKMSF